MNEQSPESFQFARREKRTHPWLRGMITPLSGVGVCFLACLLFAILSLVLPSVVRHFSIPWVLVVALVALLGIIIGGVVGMFANIYFMSVRVRIENWIGQMQFGLRHALVGTLLAALFVWIGWEYWTIWGPRLALFWLAFVSASAAVSYPLALLVFKFDPPGDP